LNLTQIQDFNNLVRTYFDPAIYNSVENSNLVDLQLKNNFKQLMNGPLETQEYLYSFCERNHIDLMKISNLWPSAPTGTINPGPDVNFTPSQITDINGGNTKDYRQSGGVVMTLPDRISELRRIGP